MVEVLLVSLFPEKDIIHRQEIMDLKEEIKNIKEQNKELLEALIELLKDCIGSKMAYYGATKKTEEILNYYNDEILIIEKATNKTWKEICEGE
jgi:hypothetical protein